jgi:hypothetical protein
VAELGEYARNRSVSLRAVDMGVIHAEFYQRIGFADLLTPAGSTEEPQPH